MDGINKSFSLFIIFALAISSLLVIEPTDAQSIPKPSVPEFTVALVNSSYDITPATTTDPFTGKIMTHASSHVEARTIEIRIKNEPFTPFSVTEGSANWTVYFSYNIRWKGHWEQEWREIYSPSNGFLSRDEGSETVYSNQGEYSSADGLKLTEQGMYNITLSPNGEVDFQVEAMIGYTHRVVEGGMAPWYFFGETSGWSTTQSLTINTNSPAANTSTSTAPTESPTAASQLPDSGGGLLFGLGWGEVAVIVLLVVVAVLLGVVVVFLYKRTVKKLG
jgi:hypothetical protein